MTGRARLCGEPPLPRGGVGVQSPGCGAHPQLLWVRERAACRCTRMSVSLQRCHGVGHFLLTQRRQSPSGSLLARALGCGDTLAHPWGMGSVEMRLALLFAGLLALTRTSSSCYIFPLAWFAGWPACVPSLKQGDWMDRGCPYRQGGHEESPGLHASCQLTCSIDVRPCWKFTQQISEKVTLQTPLSMEECTLQL